MTGGSNRSMRSDWPADFFGKNERQRRSAEAALPG